MSCKTAVRLGDAVRPQVSDTRDYETEMVVVMVRRPGTSPWTTPILHRASVFNEGSVREFSEDHEWACGKNFDNTGGSAPGDGTRTELSAGGNVIKIPTRPTARLQSDNPKTRMFPSRLDAGLSQRYDLRPGDIIITGTSLGRGFARHASRVL